MYGYGYRYNSGLVLGAGGGAPFVNTYSLDFDGVDDFVNCGVVSDLVSSSAFSLSGWFYFTASAATGKTFYSYGGDTNQYSITVQTLAGGNILFVIANAITDAGSNYILTNLTTPLTTGQWYNIICTFDGSQTGNTNRAKIYVNGTEATYGGGGGTIPATTTASTGSFNIGQWELGGSNRFFPGNIDEVAIYDYPLTAADALAIGGTVPTDLNLLATPPIDWFRMGDNGTWKSPQWLLPNNENKDKVSNYSFDFDGVDDYIDCGDSDDFSFGNGTTDTPFSLSSWIKMDDASGFFIFSKGNTFSSNYEYLLNINNSDKLGLYLYDSSNNSRIGRIYNTALTSYQNQWINLVATYDGSSASSGIKIYLNGTRVDDTDSNNGTYVAMENGNRALNIGRSETGSYAEGYIDEAAIFNSELSASDIIDIYNGGEPTTLPSGAVAHWRMGEDASFNGTNWTVPDSVGSNDGTSNAMTIEDRVGEAPSSNNNALSYNMDLVDRVTDTP